MAKYVFVVMTNAAEGQEAEFNRWYDEEHLGDVLKLPGMVSAQRFQVAPEEADNPRATLKFLTLYEIETDDLARTQAALAAAAGARHADQPDPRQGRRLHRVLQGDRREGPRPLSAPA